MDGLKQLGLLVDGGGPYQRLSLRVFGYLEPSS